MIALVLNLNRSVNYEFLKPLTSRCNANPKQMQIVIEVKPALTLSLFWISMRESDLCPGQEVSWSKNLA